MQDSTCADLARSIEHEVYRALTLSATRKGIVADGITTVVRLTGHTAGEVRSALGTLIDMGSVEPLGEGNYQVFDRCRCASDEVFSVPVSIERMFDAAGASNVSEGHVASDAKTPWVGVRSSRGNSWGLSRSLPENRQQTISQQLVGLSSYFRQSCADQGISLRDFSYPALRANLTRWHREGTPVEVMRTMVDLFVKLPEDRFTRRTVAWKLFVHLRPELEAKARALLPAQPEVISATVDRMRRTLARQQAELAAL